jgi:hypothetical protein
VRIRHRLPPIVWYCSFILPCLRCRFYAFLLSHFKKKSANLKKGEKVKFSGIFFTGSDTDYLKVTGMNTRDAMEMRNDGFLMKFANIQPLN